MKPGEAQTASGLAPESDNREPAVLAVCDGGVVSHPSGKTTVKLAVAGEDSEPDTQGNAAETDRCSRVDSTGNINSY